MAPKAAQDRAKKKAAKQKKLLIVLGVLMLPALYYAYSTMSGLGGKKVTAAPPTSAPASASSTPAAPGTPTDATITPGVAGIPVVALRSFTALGRKDPFHDHGPNPSGASSSSSGSSSSTSSKSSGKTSGGKTSGGGGGSTPKPPTAPLTGAVISINGKKLALALGAEFGQAPGLSDVKLFRLVKATAKTAVIGVVGTQQQFTLHAKRPLTLQQTGGWTYTLILEPLGTAAPMTVQPSTTPIHDQGS
ncbi:MAG TPA: hypothetical protein VGH79_03370 [Gaiellaceae bacterium]|jgi:hypothetical protein